MMWSIAVDENVLKIIFHVPKAHVDIGIRFDPYEQ